jgi:hypothetical protein
MGNAKADPYGMTTKEQTTAREQTTAKGETAEAVV